MRRARVDALGHAGDELVLPDASAHHLVRVLRQAPGATVELFDGSGARATAELLAADPVATKNLAIRSKYLDDPRGLLAPHFKSASPRYRALDAASEQLFWRLFRTRETDTPWSHFFYNLTLGIDWAPEQMSEAEATRLLIPENRRAMGGG